MPRVVSHRSAIEDEVPTFKPDAHDRCRFNDGLERTRLVAPENTVVGHEGHHPAVGYSRALNSRFIRVVNRSEYAKCAPFRLSRALLRARVVSLGGGITHALNDATVALRRPAPGPGGQACLGRNARSHTRTPRPIRSRSSPAWIQSCPELAKPRSALMNCCRSSRCG